MAPYRMVVDDHLDQPLILVCLEQVTLSLKVWREGRLSRLNAHIQRRRTVGRSSVPAH